MRNGVRSCYITQQINAPDESVIYPFTATGVAVNRGADFAVNRGADFVKHLVPLRRARQNKALDPTALLGASWCKHPASPAMLAGQRRD